MKRLRALVGCDARLDRRLGELLDEDAILFRCKADPATTYPADNLVTPVEPTERYHAVMAALVAYKRELDSGGASG